MAALAHSNIHNIIDEKNHHMKERQ